MAFNPLPLSYCTNVHPGLTVAAVMDGLSQFSAPIAAKYGRPLAAGLWLARPVIDELKTADSHLGVLADRLRQLGLTCYTLNAFPYGDFHSDRVKEQVYLPDWTQDARRQYTLDCAAVLSQLLPDDAEGSISTLPLGFKPLATSSNLPSPPLRGRGAGGEGAIAATIQPLSLTLSPRGEGTKHNSIPTAYLDSCIAQLIRTALALAELRQSSGKTIRLAIEPEPCCVLETTPETISFFQRLRQTAASPTERDAVREHLGVCYDVCHQSVEFEDVTASIHALADAGIRINKVHITNAIEVPHPGTNPAALTALAKYAEPRYLHQTFAKSTSGQVVHQLDLDRGLCESPPEEFRDAEIWRIHFHVPVDKETLGPLNTTRPDLLRRSPPCVSWITLRTWKWKRIRGKCCRKAARRIWWTVSSASSARRGSCWSGYHPGEPFSGFEAEDSSSTRTMCSREQCSTRSRTPVAGSAGTPMSTRWRSTSTRYGCRMS